MRQCILIIFSVIFFPTESFAEAIGCTRVQRNSTCFIEGLSFESPSDEYTAEFPTTLHIVIESSEILHFTTHLFDALGDTIFLTLKASLIPSITFRSDGLHCLRIDNTGLREFTVTAAENRNLNTLIISGNPLSAIPSSIRHLTGLSILDLSNNQLEYVNLNWFQAMDNLLVLDLSSNRITRFEIQPTLRLGRLKNFWVNHNRLREIEFFPHFMPALRRVRLVDNEWSCEWVTHARQFIWSSTIQVYGAENICVDKVDGGLCCYESHEQPIRKNVANVRRPLQPLPRAESLLALNDNRAESARIRQHQSFEALDHKYRRLVEEKELLEKRFVNTVQELERTIRRLTAELTEAQDVIQLLRMQAQ